MEIILKKTALIATFLSFFCLVNLTWGEIDLQRVIKASESGDARAQHFLGMLYAQGRGILQNYAEAVKWYRKAAEQGLPGAQYFLGVMYAQGRGVPQNYAEAMKWHRKAAEQGDGKSQGVLGIMYHLGRGVPKNSVKAYMWFSISSANGNEESRKLLELLSFDMPYQQIIEADNEAAELWQKINCSKK